MAGWLSRYAATHDAGTAGSVWGVFVNTAGVTAQPRFLIHSGGRANFARAVYSPHVSNGAGGHGGFLVTWTEPFTPGSFSRVVAYPNRAVGTTQTLSADYSLREVDGDWLPPGLTPPSTPPPPSPTGCATPDMPAAFRTLGLPVYFEGILRHDILHTFPAPILQLRLLVAQ